MVLYFSIIFGLYYLFAVTMIYGWGHHVKTDCTLPPRAYISVVLAVRNEEKNIEKLLLSLSRQHFPRNQFEIIVVDDGSEDRTVSLIKRQSAALALDVRTITSSGADTRGMASKKTALVQGIAASRGDIILLTDGDCWFGNEWISTMQGVFSDPKTMFAAGPVALSGKETLFHRMQSIEFASLMGSGGALINLGYPLMCNGANLAFRKAAFAGVSGYDGTEATPSGDDVFLMQKINQAYRGSVIFNKNPKALVFTYPHDSIRALIQQRRRWASKWSDFLLPFSWGLPVFLFLHYSGFVLAMLWFLIDYRTLLWLLPAIAIKVALDFIILKKAMDFCNLPMGWPAFLMSELIYPFYALFTGISVHFGSYSWKGRKHKM